MSGDALIPAQAPAPATATAQWLSTYAQVGLHTRASPHLRRFPRVSHTTGGASVYASVCVNPTRHCAPAVLMEVLTRVRIAAYCLDQASHIGPQDKGVRKQPSSPAALQPCTSRLSVSLSLSRTHTCTQTLGTESEGQLMRESGFARSGGSGDANDPERRLCMPRGDCSRQLPCSPAATLPVRESLEGRSVGAYLVLVTCFALSSSKGARV